MTIANDCMGWCGLQTCFGSDTMDEICDVQREQLPIRQLDGHSALQFSKPNFILFGVNAGS